MNLALYSNQTIPETEEITSQLISRIGKRNPKIGYISSAPDPERYYYDSISAYYRHFGASVGKYNDLEDNYDAETLEDAFDSDALHLTGGNTYRFLSWVKKRSIKQKLVKYAKDKGVLIGVSAGSIIMSPTIEASALCGDSNEIGLSDLRGLSLFPFQLIPHAQDISDLKTKAQEIVQKMEIPAYTIRDNQALFYDGNRVEIIGGAEFYPITSKEDKDNQTVLSTRRAAPSPQ